jgi:rod shape-determining protein MreC
MENLIGRYRNVSILAAAIFLQIVGLAVQVKRQAENRSSRLIRVWAVTAVTPLEKGIVRLQTGTTGIWRNYLYLRGARQENRDLHQQVQQLQLEQVRLKQDAEQAHRLQALLGFKEQFIARTTAAQVIGSSGSEQSRIVYLDKGSNQGIKRDMAVISGDGVVGKVILTFGDTSQVLLINDQTSGVGAILEQSRLQGILKGKASGELVLDKIMSDEEVKLGEKVLTSGGDQIFPKGLPIGSVSKVSTGGQFLQVTLRPSAELDHLEEVLVITQKQERAADTASGSTAARAADILAQRLPSVPDKPETLAPSTPRSPAQSPVGGTPSVQVRSQVNAAPPPPGTQVSSTEAQTKAQPASGSAIQTGVSAAPAKTQGTLPRDLSLSKPSAAAAQDPKAVKPAAAKPAIVKPAIVPGSKPATNVTQQQAPSQPPSDSPGDTPQ